MAGNLERNVTILDYWRVLWRARWRILVTTAVAVVVAFAVGRLLPRTYIATATILSPKESGPQSLSMSIGTLLSNVGSNVGGGQGGGRFSLPGGGSLGLPSVANNQDLFVALLRSRTLKKDVLVEFAKKWGPSVGGLVVSVEPTIKEKGVMGLTVEARDPQFAAEFANYHFEYLDRVLERYAEQAAVRQRAFYAKQIEHSARELAVAENEVLKFQTENRALGTPGMEGSGKGGDAGFSLRTTIMALEMQREVNRMKMTDQHPQMRELDKRIAEMKKLYSKNLFGSPMDLPPEGPGARGIRKEFFVSAEKMTPVQFSYLKLYRNLKIQEAFSMAALQGIEQLKYNEGASRPMVEMLDPATQPGKHTRPNIPYIVTAGAGAALVTGCFMALILEYLNRLRAEERQARAVAIRRSGRSDGGTDLHGNGAESGKTPEETGARDAPVPGPRSAAGIGARPRE